MTSESVPFHDWDGQPSIMPEVAMVPLSPRCHNGAAIFNPLVDAPPDPPPPPLVVVPVGDQPALAASSYQHQHDDIEYGGGHRRSGSNYNYASQRSRDGGCSDNDDNDSSSKHFYSIEQQELEQRQRSRARLRTLAFLFLLMFWMTSRHSKRSTEISGNRYGFVETDDSHSQSLVTSREPAAKSETIKELDYLIESSEEASPDELSINATATT